MYAIIIKFFRKTSTTTCYGSEILRAVTLDSFDIQCIMILRNFAPYLIRLHHQFPLMYSYSLWVPNNLGVLSAILSYEVSYIKIGKQRVAWHVDGLVWTICEAVTMELLMIRTQGFVVV